ncbi:MAG: hypothetical protein Q9212_004150 [Teloschistes hypoglaucus]
MVGYRPHNLFERSFTPRNHGRSDEQELDRQQNRKEKNIILAEDYHHGRKKLDHPNHDVRYHLGTKYPADYPQWVPKHPRCLRKLRPGGNPDFKRGQRQRARNEVLYRAIFGDSPPPPEVPATEGDAQVSTKEDAIASTTTMDLSTNVPAVPVPDLSASSSSKLPFNIDEARKEYLELLYQIQYLESELASGAVADDETESYQARLAELRKIQERFMQQSQFHRIEPAGTVEAN